MTEEELLFECDKIRDIDDRLGAFSDHEGDGEGPTFRTYKSLGKSGLMIRCEEAIDLHSIAVIRWKRIKNLLAKS